MWLSIGLISSCRFKNFMQPLQSILIAGLSLCITSKPPVIMNTSRYPLMWEILTLENDQGWKWAAICTDTFHRRYPFLISWLWLKLLLNCSINNTLWSLHIVNCKSTFIHVVHVFRLDIVLLNHTSKILKPLYQSFHWHILDSCSIN